MRPSSYNRPARPLPPARPPQRHIAKIVVVVVVLGVVAALFWWLRPSPTPSASTADEQEAPVFNKTLFSTDAPGSPWVVVNKKRPLNPKDYAPGLATPNIPLRISKGGEEMQVSADITAALEHMVATAKQQGVSLMLASGYRSYGLQAKVYASEVKAYGQAAADQESARPGHSEHQTGLAVDFEPTDRSCEIQACFADTPEGAWLAEHAWEYGFILRYTSDKVSTTGYTYEPWHFRYVGPELAAELHRTGVKTLEEFFDAPGGASY